MEYEYFLNDDKTIDMDSNDGPEMSLSRREVWVLLLYELHLRRKATEVANNICNTRDNSLFSIRPTQYWFNRFRNGNLELGVNLLEQLGCSHTAVKKNLNKFGKTWRQSKDGSIFTLIISTFSSKRTCTYIWCRILVRPLVRIERTCVLGVQVQVTYFFKYEV